MVCGAKEKEFSFWMPLQIQKGQKDEMRIGGVASDEDSPDIQGEKVFVDGLDISYLLQRGAFNWDHGKGPDAILGEVDTAQKDGKKLYVEGFLYPHVDAAKHTYNLMRSLKDSGSGRRLGLSIEGKVKERDTETGKQIKKAWIKNIAVTYNPINQGTFVDLIKSMGDFTFSSCSGDCNKCTVVCDTAQKSEEGATKDSKEVKETINLKAEVLTEGSPNSSKQEIDSPKLSKGQESAPSSDELKKEEVEKADASSPGLKAGHDIPAATGGVSGSALREEDLDKKKKVMTYDTKKKRKKDGEFTKSELVQWLQDTNTCSKRSAEVLAELLLKSVQVAGYVRTRRGRLERVKPFTKELSHEVQRMNTMSERALMGRAMKITSVPKMLHFFAAAKEKGMNDLAAVIKQQGIRHLGLKERDFDDVRKEIKYYATA